MSPCTSGPCSSNYFLCLPLLDSLLSFVLPFLNCAANLPLGLSQQYLVFLPPVYAWLSISGFTNLSHFQNLRSYISLLHFGAHLPTNCYSCHCSNSSHGNFLPPYPVQPVTPLLRSIIMAQWQER